MSAIALNQNIISNLNELKDIPKAIGKLIVKGLRKFRWTRLWGPSPAKAINSISNN